jgi:hypothetical protein
MFKSESEGGFGASQHPGQRKCHVNASAPRWIATEMTALVREHPDDPECNRMILARTAA